MPRLKYNDIIKEETRLQQEHAHLEHQLVNLEANTRRIIEAERGRIINELEDIEVELRTIGLMKENWEPIPPLPPLLMLPNDSVSSGPGSLPYVPGSPQYAPGSPISTVPNSPQYAQPDSPGSLHLSDLNISRESQDEIVDVDPTPQGSPNRTPPPSSPQVPSAPGRHRHSGNPVGGTKKKKGKKRKTMKKKKTAKKGKKTKKR
tara:strand:- start:354 stop:965 length:612 start_codon:yes stop_codon:yes gene_type:complete